MSDLSNSKPPPDWALARALYFQGVKTALIAQQAKINLHTLYKRMERENWSKDLAEFKAQLSRSNAAAIGTTLQSVTEIGQFVRHMAAGALGRAAKGLDSGRDPKTLKARRELAETVKAITDPAKTVFAWEDQKPTVVLDLGSLRSVQRATPVIDVTQVPATSIAAQTTEPKQDSEPQS